MKTDVTYIDAAKFETILLAAQEQHGFEVHVQKGFVKLQGPRGYALYVAATKRVGRVDISGFEYPTGTRVPHCGVFGNVKQQLDMGLPEDEVLKNFCAIVEHMATLAPAEKPARKEPEKKGDEPKGWTKVDVTREGRLQKLKARGARLEDASSLAE